MKSKTKFGIVVVLAMAALGRLNATEGDLPYYGSNLNDLDAVIEKAPGKTLFIKVDESGGPSANINVQIHQFPGTIREYMDLSKKQFDQFFAKGWKVLSEKQDEKEASCEVVGTTKGKEYHSYSRAVKEGTKLYVVTATALHEQWGSVGEKMRRHVDAFRAK